MSKKWTQAKIAECINVIQRHSEYQAALEELGESKDALYNAFTRAGLEAPSTYLGKTKTKPATKTPEDDLIVITVFNDVHIPNHNERACQNVLQCISDEQPNRVVINGDLLDCYWLSSFPKEAGIPSFQAEIDMAIEFLEDLRAIVPDAQIDYLEGNHEERLKRRLKEMQAFHSLRSLNLEHLLCLAEFDITYHAYKKPLNLHGNTLSIIHGHKVSKHSAYTAKSHLLDDDFQNVIMGHTHRMGIYYKSGHLGRRRGVENGGLFDINKLDYVTNPNWQNGFCMVYLRHSDPNWIQIHPIEMTNEGAFVWKGKLYE